MIPARAARVIQPRRPRYSGLYLLATWRGYSPPVSLFVWSLDCRRREADYDSRVLPGAGGCFELLLRDVPGELSLLGSGERFSVA